ncbi:hypothetical protein NMY22_g5728 [Coprinellus aureogranulatus]|nr:hypothetical protein NMY22_g5728 [Coprinellus aureogranulatus]
MLFNKLLSAITLTVLAIIGEPRLNNRSPTVATPAPFSAPAPTSTAGTPVSSVADPSPLASGSPPNSRTSLQGPWEKASAMAVGLSSLPSSGPVPSAGTGEGGVPTGSNGSTPLPNSRREMEVAKGVLHPMDSPTKMVRVLSTTFASLLDKPMRPTSSPSTS